MCKNHAVGRQCRTLSKHIKNQIKYIPYGFNAIYKGMPISRENWMNSEVGQSRVFGEYLRIIFLGKKGDILPIEETVNELDEYVISIIPN